MFKLTKNTFIIKTFAVFIFFFSASVAMAAPISFTSNSPLILTSPSVTLTALSGSVADGLVVNAGNVIVSMSASTGGTFVLTSPRAMTVTGGSISQSCSTGTETETITQVSGSASYTLTPTGSACTAGFPTATSVNITGTTTVGQTLTGHYSFSDPNSLSDISTYQWSRATISGGSYSNISGATNATYVLTSADIGQYIKFTVTPTSSAGAGTAVPSSPTAQISSSAGPTASSLSITGTQTEGQTLTGHYTYTQADSVAEGVSTFRWLESTTSGGSYSAISSATSNTYALAPSDVGKFIKFEVTPVAVYPVTLGTAVPSSPTGAIAASSLPVASAVSVTGTLTQGQTLTGHYTYSDTGSHSEATSTFRWLSSTTSGGSYSAIGGATSSTYILTSSETGKYVRFEVTPVSTVTSGSPVQSNPTTQIQNTGVPTASSVNITGTQNVGQTLTGTYIYADPGSFAEGASTYRWLESDTSGGTYTAINGATSNTYVLQSSDLNKFIKFEVTPVASVPPTSGTAVPSSATSAIGEAIINSGGGGGSISGGYIPPVSTPVSTVSGNTSSSSGSTTYNFGTVTLKNGSIGDAVKELQRFLNDSLQLGLVVDGKLGPMTIDVIKKWQTVHGLVPDGLIGPKTKALMNNSASVSLNTPANTTHTGTYNFGFVTLQIHSKGEAVKELQRFLNNTMHLGLKIDGILGSKTIAVIKKWQTAHGLSPDGLIGPHTKAAMQASVEN